MSKTIKKPLSNASQATILGFAVAALACSKPQHVEMARPIDSVAGVLEVVNGYGGKLMILSNPKITTPRRDIVRVDSFYVDPSHSGDVRPPHYQRLLHWPSSTGTDTVGGNPVLITDGRLGGGEDSRDQLFNPNMQRVLVGKDVATIGVLPPAAAIVKYGEYGRNGAIVMTTKREEQQPDDGASEISDRGALVEDTTRPMPGRVHVRFVVDTTGHVDPNSFVVICRETPGAFLELAKREAVLGTIWKPARLHGRPVREEENYALNTPVDSTQGVGDTPSQCGD